MPQSFNSKKNILIADDDPMTHRLVKGFLTNIGYNVTSARNGKEALEELNNRHYDLLISDIEMPVLDGIELTKIIKKTGRLQNLPIIMISANNNIRTKLEAFDAHADDYVAKPFFFDELAARIKTQLRIKHLQEEIADKNRILNNRNRELEDNLDLAKDIQQKLMPLDTKEINNIKVDSFYRPIDKVGGDIFDVIPHTDGKVTVFIGDVAGHGVPAAFINIILRMLLHSMIKKNDESYPDKLLEEINNEIMKYIQAGEFITALIGIIDPGQNKFIYSSAGNPPGFIISKNGIIDNINSKGFCLGFTNILNPTVHTIELNPGDKIILFTDGLIEVKNSGGKFIGIDGIRDIIKSIIKEGTCKGLLTNIIDKINEYYEYEKYEDDITLLCFEIPDTSQFTWSTCQIDIKESIMSLTGTLSTRNILPPQEIKKISTALNEAISNAIDHGNLGIPDYVRSYIDDSLYNKFKEKRLTDPKYANKKIYAMYLLEDNKVSFLIRDDGHGFSYNKVQYPTLPENLTKSYGRGLALIKLIMDEVSFNEKGNEIRLVKYF